jgi:hypothetical protein
MYHISFFEENSNPLPIFFFVFPLNERIDCTKRGAKGKRRERKKKKYRYRATRPKRKRTAREGNCLATTLRDPSFLIGLDTYQVRLFQMGIEHCPLSKIMEFLKVHIAQHAMITISLKIWLPNYSPAFTIISSGGKLRFQLIGMELQHA